VAYAGSLVQWARDNLKLIKHASETEAICRSVEDNGGVYIVPAFAGLFAPYWRSDARGVICGLTAFNTSAHVVRACVEASAYQVKDILDAMAEDSNVHLHTLRCDGGMTANAFLMQFQADMLDVAVTVPSVSETTALGAAYACGLAVGFFPNLETLTRAWTMAHEWQPHMPEPQRQYFASKWEMAIDRSLDWHTSARPGPGLGSKEKDRLAMVRSGSSRVSLDRAGEHAAAAWAGRLAALALLLGGAFIWGRASVGK
jgi:glycerol kinase